MRTPVAWVLALPLLLLVGCSPVGPKYKRPTVQTPAIYKELPTGANDEWKTAQPSDSELRGNWWELFNDPKLNQLEPLVSLSNETVRQTEARFRQARAFVAFNRANYYPTVTIGTSGSVTYTSRSTPGFTTGGSTNVRNANANPFLEYSFPHGISWEPNLWGRVTLAVQSAVSNAQSVAADLENVRLSLQAELAADYFLMHGIDMQASLLARTIAAYERALQLTINRYNGGVSSKADVLQAQTQLETTRAAMTDLGVQRAAYEHAIAVLSGQPPASLSLPAQDIVGGPPPVPAGLPSQLLERRPDIASAERQVASANAQIGLARVAYFPSLTLNASAGFQSGFSSAFIAAPTRAWSLGPSISHTLLDFGRRRAELHQTEAAYDELVSSYRQTTLTAFQEVEDNLAALRVLAQEATEQEVAVQSAEQSLTLEIDRYKAGTVSYLDVITSQTIALNNERSAVVLLQRRMNAAVQLIRALGGGWNASRLPSESVLQSGATQTP
jgi:NodT family efflux transporter outer membrane factor (OMF) lipoprotein